MTVLEAVLAQPADRAERVDRITARAREIHFGRTVLALVATLLFGLGRLVFAVFAGLWLVCTWCAAAVALGWDDARMRQAARREEPDA